MSAVVASRRIGISASIVSSRIDPFAMPSSTIAVRAMPGRDRVDADPQIGDFDRHHPRQAHHRRLRRGIRPPTGQRDQPGHGRDLDDRAAAVLAHGSDRHGAAVERAHQVGLDDELPGGRVEGLGQPDSLDPGVVDEDVDAALGRLDVRERASTAVRSVTSIAR